MTSSLSSSFKVAATVREVCRLVRLSKARFYELQQAGVFPPPVYDLRTRRPHYTEELQRLCVQIRETGLAANGQPVIFYQQRRQYSRPKRTRNAKATASVPTSGLPNGVLLAVRS